MVGVVFRFEINDQWRIAVGPQGSRGEDRPFQTVRSIFREHSTRRPGRVGEMIGHGVQQLLNAVWILETAQFAEFLGCEAEVVMVHVAIGRVYRRDVASCESRVSKKSP